MFIFQYFYIVTYSTFIVYRLFTAIFIGLTTDYRWHIYGRKLTINSETSYNVKIMKNKHNKILHSLNLRLRINPIVKMELIRKLRLIIIYFSQYFATFWQLRLLYFQLTLTKYNYNKFYINMHNFAWIEVMYMNI